MTAIVEGVYKEGKIELLQPPADLPEGRVRVIVMSDDRPKPAPRMMTFGMFPGDSSTLEDFKEPQWYEKEWDDPDGQ
jgi:hypothetical protein